MDDKSVIFLDVDGVLNIMSTTYYSCGFTTLGSNPIEPHLMCRLEFILSRVPNAVIVVSSAWTLESLIIKLKKARFKYIDRIIDRTPRDELERGDQILAWIEKHAFRGNYVVLEDEIDDVCIRCKSIPRENVIEVDMNEGLSNKNTIDAIVILNEIHKYDDRTYIFNKTNYYKFLRLGYKAHVIIPEPIDYSKWDKFTVNNKYLTLTMFKHKIDV